MNMMYILGFEEGFRKAPYKCSEGYPTVGFGTKISDNKELNLKDLDIEVSRSQAREWLERDVDKIIHKIANSSNNVTFLSLDNDRRAIITSMAYQMGTYGLSRFKKMWAALEDGNWEEAGIQALDSLWAKQTPERAMRHAKILAGKETVQSTYHK